jgi:hypothetical protein
MEKPDHTVNLSGHWVRLPALQYARSEPTGVIGQRSRALVIPATYPNQRNEKSCLT